MYLDRTKISRVKWNFLAVKQWNGTVVSHYDTLCYSEAMEWEIGAKEKLRVSLDAMDLCFELYHSTLEGFGMIYIKINVDLKSLF